MSEQLNQTAPIEWQEDDEISLIDLATTLGEQKKWVLGTPALASVVSIVVALLLSPVYTAKTTLLPPGGNNGGGGAASAGIAGGFGWLGRRFGY